MMSASEQHQQWPSIVQRNRFILFSTLCFFLLLFSPTFGLNDSSDLRSYTAFVNSNNHAAITTLSTPCADSALTFPVANVPDSLMMVSPQPKCHLFHQRRMLPKTKTMPPLPLRNTKQTVLASASSPREEANLSTSLFAATTPKINQSKFKLWLTSFLRFLQNFLWKKSNPDPNYTQPLPPGSLGCPFFGNNIFQSSPNEGAEIFYTKQSARMNHARIWKFFFLNQPVVSISGGNTIRKILNREYEDFNVVGGGGGKNKKKKKGPFLYGSDTVMFERDPIKHQYLRKLVGLAMSPSACEKGIPTIAQTAQRNIEEAKQMPSSSSVIMEDLCEKYTLDIAWRQILGLQLEEEEVPHFYKAVKDYISGLFSMANMLRLPGRTRTAPYRGRYYLVSKIERRIDQLEREGQCDGSTMSRMVFATDEDDEDSTGVVNQRDDVKKRKLTREEIIENCLLLLVAGTETSASTLTAAMFLMGLHPHVWDRLVQEQRHICAKHGNTEVNKKVLDDDTCPYLEAVIKETMRILPVSGGNPRRLQKTYVLDGYQIPEGWSILSHIRLTHELDPKVKQTNDVHDKDHMNVKTGFRPERWLDHSTRPSSDFIPFGAGPRFCLGAGLAMTEMKVFLALMARMVDKIELTGSGSNGSAIRWNERSIIAKPKDGVPVRLLMGLKDR